jgi:nucleoid DNA-binding protein
MRKAKWFGAAILAGAAGLVLGQSPEPKPVQKPEAKQSPVKEPLRIGADRSGLPNTLKERVAAVTKLPPADVAKMLEALGPAVRDLLGQGQTVDVPNLGRFRVVRVPEHRDLVDGRPATIPPSNTVEFLPTGAFATAANQPGVRPAETVPPFEYNPLPDQTKSLRVPSQRLPNTRTQ